MMNSNVAAEVDGNGDTIYFGQSWTHMVASGERRVQTHLIETKFYADSPAVYSIVTNWWYSVV